MVGRSVDKKDEIRAYIKARSKLGCSLKKLMTEISTAFGPSCVSYDTVRRWKKKFEPGVESIKNAPKSGRPKSASRTTSRTTYKYVVLKKLKKYYQKRRPATGFKHVRLLHDNAPAHTFAIVTAFLKKEKVTVLHPPPPDLAPCDFFLFPKLKAFLAGRKYQSRQALGSVIHQYLITVAKSAYRDAFKKWIHRLKLCNSSHGEYFEGMK